MTSHDDNCIDEGCPNHGIHHSCISIRAQLAGDEPVAWMFQHEDTGRDVVLTNDGINTPESFGALNPRLQFVGPLYAQPPAPSVSVEALEGLCEEWENMTVPRSASSYELGEFDGYRDARRDLCALIAASKKV